jgi:hypothetical protein
MELNHQIRLCRPFPFRFGVRALINVNVKYEMRSATLLLT